ncbi:MAG: bifunctional diaminohydroxyphosphoribosylaminopyrimidine deaminase/5-amino-6-(5-phosphoribosylamino)uracil reductase RibD [Roseibacillus sp.]
MSACERDSDKHFMSLALEEGTKGLGLTAPNPSVGAVLVREGKVLGKGFHSRAGQPHAEVEALADCRRQGNDPQGSEIFITLEPCSTSGRTPPCTQAILEHGIRRAIWAVDDPNPHHQGGARALLYQEGVEITSGVLAEEAEFLHRAFFKVQRTQLPWIIVKTAMSLDGRITRPLGEGQWLTGAEARADVQVLRGEVDAILTSGSTARNDNPRLDYRGPRSEKQQPARLVFSRQPQAGLPASAHLLTPNESGPTKFLSGDLKENLTQLASEGLQTILVEAGGGLVGQLLDEGLVDEWISYFAPLVCGGDVPAVAATGATELERRPRLDRVTYQQFGPDIRLRGLVNRLSSS